jgi:hypothetical protein
MTIRNIFNGAETLELSGVLTLDPPTGLANQIINSSMFQNTVSI